MSALAVLHLVGLPEAAIRATHPLRAWRLTQFVRDRAAGTRRAMTIAEAARAYSAFIGREIPYQLWKAWELYRDEPSSRIPSWEHIRGLFAFTGEVRADHFYEINTMRRAGGGPGAGAPDGSG